jgi:hypothetical protein
MKPLIAISFAFLLANPAPGSSQPIPAGMKFGLATYLHASYDGVKADLLDAANRMPADDYGFKPGAAAEMRSYGQLFAHIAEGQFGTCAAIRGIANPNLGRSLERELTTKTDVVRALSDSFAFCDPAFATLTDEHALQFVKVGKGEVVRGAVITGLFAHNSEMYGIATVYLRAKNLVPPSTERQMQNRQVAPQ